MPSQTVSVSSSANLLQLLQIFLVEEAAWTYVDGYADGSQRADAAAFQGVSPSNYDNNDYFIVRPPAAEDPDHGVIEVRYTTAGGNYVRIFGHTAGWDATAHTPKAGNVALGTTAVCRLDGENTATPPFEARFFASTRRAIVVTLPDAVPWFGYFGFLQSYYGELGGDVDPNPILVSAGHEVPGTPSSTLPLQMSQIDGAEASYKALMSSGGLLDTDGDDMLEEMQPNRRMSPLNLQRVLFSCKIGNKAALNTEIRGELEGVFFFGPQDSISPDVSVVWSGAQYVVLGGIVIGPVD